MRDAKLFVVVGRKSCGKTYQTEKMLRALLAGNPPRKTLILDVNDEYTQFKPISPDNVEIFSMHPLAEIRRIRPFRPDGKRFTLNELADVLFGVLETFKNGVLLIEDVNKYISDTMPNDLVGAICTNRHIGVDIIMHYQSIGRITTKVWQNVNIIRLHKFTDTVRRHRLKFEDKVEYLSIAEMMINQKYDEGDKRFFVYVDIDDEVIYGNFSDQDFENAVNAYIRKNYRAIINPLLQERDEMGKKVYNPQTAMAEAKRQLMTYKKS